MPYPIRLLYQYLEENFFSASLNGRYDYLNFTKTATTLLILVGGICLGILAASVVAIFQKKVVGRFMRALIKAGATSPETAKSLSELSLEKSGVIKHELSHASVSRKMVGIVEGNTVTTYTEELAAAFPEYAAEIRAAEAALTGEKKSELTGAADAIDAEDKPDAEVAKATDEAEASTATAAEDDVTLIPESDMAKEKASIKERLFGAGRKTKEFFFAKSFKPHRPDFTVARFFIPKALLIRAEFRFREKGSSWLSLLLAVLLVTALFFASLYLIPVFVRMLDSSIGNIVGG